ncbi:hypothetical protein F8O01_01975 [Pseudoclavibacter chungangensis]|uniref:Uncharacterized protein n=1 Tax=Pseudoclavibacter chungangensis TaxID=587635 RepID=A0A7J5C247_9MICO|nr:hypothetical protein [Pseudoclavibacter chungangensis]KAB1662250.1 hypothetical protein F8O01_01975 [Pseudoclavibacter chungangensis]NYJ65455.1 hypothetical protein [Pseudoclavibacter chungangensis]
MTSFVLQPEGTHAGAQYDPASKAITLPLECVRPERWADAADTIYLLGHEIQHAHNSSDIDHSTHLFSTEIVASTRAGETDYATALNQYLDACRADEDRADLEGWNTFVEFAASSKVPLPMAVAQTVRARTVADSVDRRHVRFGIGFAPNPDGSLESSEQNLAAMRRYYTGAAPDMTNIGRTGESDYANYYTAAALSFIGQVHREHHAEIASDHARRVLPRPAEPPIRIDLATHGLTPDLLEKNGIDLGPDAEPLHYLDTSTRPPTPGILRPLRYSRDESAPARPSTAHEHFRARWTNTGPDPGGPGRAPAGAPAGTRLGDATPTEASDPRHASRTASPASCSTPGDQNTTPTPRTDAARRAVERATRPRTSGAPRRGNTGIGR